MGVELAQSGASGMAIPDLLAKIPGLDTCAGCVAGPHKEGRRQAVKCPERVHIHIYCPMFVASAGGRDAIVVYTRPLRLKSGAVEVFTAFKRAVENEFERKIRETTMYNTHKLSVGKMSHGIKLYMTVPCHPASNGGEERMIGPLTSAVRAGHGRVQVGFCGPGAANRFMCTAPDHHLPVFALWSRSAATVAQPTRPSATKLAPVPL